MGATELSSISAQKQSSHCARYHDIGYHSLARGARAPWGWHAGSASGSGSATVPVALCHSAGGSASEQALEAGHHAPPICLANVAEAAVDVVCPQATLTVRRRVEATTLSWPKANALAVPMM